MTEYEMNLMWLKTVLAAYRSIPENARHRRSINRLIERSRDAATGTEEKKLHNLIVLEYITDTERAKSAICEALHISPDRYEEAKQRAIDRLCVLAFGVDGLDLS